MKLFLTKLSPNNFIFVKRLFCTYFIVKLNFVINNMESYRFIFMLDFRYTYFEILIVFLNETKFDI